jgi:hypothetical protein
VAAGGRAAADCLAAALADPPDPLADSQKPQPQTSVEAKGEDIWLSLSRWIQVRQNDLTSC